MPDHIHFLIGWHSVPPAYNGSLSDFVAQVKAMTTRASRFNRDLHASELIWSPGYWDLVIRDERQRLNVRRYIEENAARAWRKLNSRGAGQS